MCNQLQYWSYYVHFKMLFFYDFSLKFPSVSSLKTLVKLFPLLHDHILWSHFPGDVFPFHHQLLIDIAGSSYGCGPDIVCNISISEFKCFQSQKYCLVLPAWNPTLRFVSCVLSIHTSSCGISSLWNDVASGWHSGWPAVLGCTGIFLGTGICTGDLGNCKTVLGCTGEILFF